MKKYVALLAVAYIGLLFTFAYGFHFFAPERQPPSSINPMVIVLSVLLVSFLFARKHKRTLTSAEYPVLVAGGVVVDATVQFLAVLPLIVSGTPSAHPLLPGFILVVGGHAALFAIGFSSFAMRRYVSASAQPSIRADGT